ncbi:hypothetical protein [Streptomyces sp. NPDC051569]|uniref:hypothetical protein n=1 Tax=Streptomyces sp. NPDC051569 TaxID=3365661 RepID=UPI00379F8203
MPARVIPLGVTLAAGLLSALGYSLLIPWDLRNNVPVSPGSDTLTSAVTWWGVVLLVVLLAACAAAAGRLGRPAWAAHAVGWPPVILLLVSSLSHQPEADGFAAFWLLDWLFTSALVLEGSTVVSHFARSDLPDGADRHRSLTRRTIAVGVFPAAGISAFLAIAFVATGSVTETVVALAFTGAVGWATALAARSGPGHRTGLAVGALGIVVVAVIDRLTEPLWDWRPYALLAWALLLAAYVVGFFLSRETARRRASTA